ncbi:MAG: hypothetical protein WCG92_16260 [Hyphomicrobiales bacterium]
MDRSLYRPTRRQAVLLASLALSGLTYEFFMRYQVIESAAVGIACGESGGSWLCASRRTTIALFTPQGFGIVALGAAALNLLRPSVIFWGLTLLTAASGLVLYNTGLSAFAVALLILSLARPVPEAS